MSEPLRLLLFPTWKAGTLVFSKTILKPVTHYHSRNCPTNGWGAGVREAKGGMFYLSKTKVKHDCFLLLDFLISSNSLLFFKDSFKRLYTVAERDS